MKLHGRLDANNNRSDLMNYARWLISKIVLDSFVNISFLRCRENIDEFMKTCFNTESKPGENIGFVHSLRAVQYTEFA